MSTQKSLEAIKLERDAALSLERSGIFVVKGVLGAGRASVVFKALSLALGRLVAVKCIQRNAQSAAPAELEAKIWKTIQHPSCARLLTCWTDGAFYFFEMELSTGGNLLTFLQQNGLPGEERALDMFRQIVSALHYLHSIGVVHRDVKLENILVEKDGSVKLADFGFADYWSTERTLRRFCGSLHYCAPEICLHRPYMGPEVDAWSLGCVLYSLTTGSMAFDAPSRDQLIRQICAGKYRAPKNVSGACADLISSLLMRDPKKRMTLPEVFSHPWVVYGPSLHLAVEQPAADDAHHHHHHHHHHAKHHEQQQQHVDTAVDGVDSSASMQDDARNDALEASAVTE